MTKEEAVERIVEFLKKRGTLSDAFGQQRLLEILTELMETIGEDEVIEFATARVNNFLCEHPKIYHNGFVDGAKWAATRNLKVSLEGLDSWTLNTDRISMKKSKSGGIFYLKSDVEKLVK